jgi:hypothetical protein
MENIGGGAAREQFDDALCEVLANIQDPNTKAEAVREVTLKVKFKPNEDRTESIIEINVAPKLAPAKPYPSRIFIGKSIGGQPEAHEVNANQSNLFPKQKENVTAFRKEEAAND